MVNIVIVYESLYGNTGRVAEAVAEGLAAAGTVTVTQAAEAGDELVRDADLLVVGGPTHVHGMSSNLSRKGAIDDARKKGLQEPTIPGVGLRDWLDRIAPGEARRAAAFDTRLGKPRLLTGSAAHGIARRLRGQGYDVVGEESFVVEDTAGPLRAGELDRARKWAHALAGS